jgi:hypothetical protein
MEDIRQIFLTKTIPDFLRWEVNMPYIKFLFDSDTLKSFDDYLDKKSDDYSKGLNSIRYLTQIYQESMTNKEQIYIRVHDSDRFFKLLEELIDCYSKKNGHALLYHYNFIRSIWLRMGVSDIDDVEGFLERQINFIKNETVLNDYKEIDKFASNEVLACHISENEDWFETNKNIVFSIRRTPDSYLEPDIDYEFPAIHFAVSNLDGKKTCFIYGMQSLHKSDADEIKSDIQFVRKSLRNKNVSADFIIGMSLFLDYLYDHGITDIEIPTLQVFNYVYHECLSDTIFNSYSSYTDDDIKEIEDMIKLGVLTDKVTDYLHTYGMVSRFVGKQDSISYNKSERFINIFVELMEKNPNIELVCEPFVQGENMKIRINGKSNILDVYKTKKRTL